MTETVYCEEHVGSVHPPRCRACDLEREVTANPAPDYAPRVIDLDRAEAEADELAGSWQRAVHPSDAADSIRELLARSDPFWTALVTRAALDRFVTWLTYEARRAEMQTQSRLVYVITRTLRDITPTNSVPRLNYITAPNPQEHP